MPLKAIQVSCSFVLFIFTALVQANPTTPLTTIRVWPTGGGGFLSLPDYATSPPGDAQRLFIVEQRTSINTQGRIRILRLSDNVLLSPEFLLTSGQSAGGSEEGLLGLAFHPDFFAANPNPNRGAFFIYITQNGDNHIFRYTTTGQDPNANTADTASAQRIITFSHPTNTNHDGGWIAFGPDRQLYVNTGDGGGGCDSPGNAQNVNSFLGKMHRLNVDTDQAPGDNTLWGYSIPAGNPFVGVPGLDEIWLYGFRNPWRSSFDRLTGAIYVGDVGENGREEVDYVPPGASGINYGWDQREGFSCSSVSGCPSTCTTVGMTDPIWDFDHSLGRCAITGGYVYRGPAIPDLQGTYFFADYCGGQTYSFVPNGNTPIPAANVTDRTTELAPVSGNITSFGEDANGEIYIINQGGEIFKIVANCAGSTLAFQSQPPANQTVPACSNVTLTVAVNGLRGAVNYAWRKGSVAIPGAPNSPSYSINPLKMSDAGLYDVVVHDQCNTVTSNGSMVTVNPSTLPNGDVEGDCDLDFADIDLFINVLLGTDNDAGHVSRSNVNHDATTDGRDIVAMIQVFVP